MLDLLKYRYIYLLISGIIIVPGLIFLALGGLKPGIDFKGGSELTIVLPKGSTTNASAVEGIVRTVSYIPANGGNAQKLDDVQAQFVQDPAYPNQQEYLIRMPDIGSDVVAQRRLQAALDAAFEIKGKQTTPVQHVQQLGFSTVKGKGTDLTVVLPKGVTVTTAQVSAIVQTVTYKAANGHVQPLTVTQVQVVGDRHYPTQQEYLIRMPDAGANGAVVTAQHQVLAALDAQYAVKPHDNTQHISESNFNSVGGTIASDTTSNATNAVLAAAVAILLYMAWAFRKLPHPFVYSGAAIAALLHDVLVVLGLFAILGFFFNVRVDALFVPAVLTIIGFSVHDTIVVFDRIRENMGRRTGEPYYQVVNASLSQTLGRSLNTSLTVLLTLLALLLFGGTSIHIFVLALLIGITSGTYSSIFNATPLAVIWEMGELPGLFGRGKKPGGGTGTTRTVAARRPGTAR